MRRWDSSFILSVTLLLCCGCGGSGAPLEEAVPVSGTLTYQGKPLVGYQIDFVPADGRRPASGITDAEGKFTLSTNDEGDGAPPGLNKVSVAWAGPPQSGEPGNEQPIDNPALLPKQPVNLPSKYANPDESGLTQEVPEDGIEDLKIDLP